MLGFRSQRSRFGKRPISGPKLVGSFAQESQIKTLEEELQERIKQLEEDNGRRRPRVSESQRGARFPVRTGLRLVASFRRLESRLQGGRLMIVSHVPLGLSRRGWRPGIQSRKLQAQSPQGKLTPRKVRSVPRHASKALRHRCRRSPRIMQHKCRQEEREREACAACCKH